MDSFSLNIKDQNLTISAIYKARSVAIEANYEDYLVSLTN